MKTVKQIRRSLRPQFYRNRRYSGGIAPGFARQGAGSAGGPRGASGGNVDSAIGRAVSNTIAQALKRRAKAKKLAGRNQPKPHRDENETKPTQPHPQ